MMTRVVLAMSGGVDSSVAAYLLLQNGYDVTGVFMRHGIPQATCDLPDNSAHSLPVLPNSGRLDHKQGCCTAADAEDARRVADMLRIPFHALNLDHDFERIVDYFVDEYAAGRTPNPCVMCNNWIKFGKLFQYAASIDAHYVATGHYARVLTEPDGRMSLRRGRDDRKDQSYVLFGVQRRDLQRMLLPLGGYRKESIRMIAAEQGLLVADKRDSQEICFVTSGQHAAFVRDRRQAAGLSLAGEGEIVTTEGHVVGTHQGIEGYTIGQRKGLGVALGEPYFVVRLEPATNRVVLGRRDELACSGLSADHLNWLVEPPAGEVSCAVQIRYNSRPQPARIWRTDKNELRVHFVEPCQGVAPGQAVVCYDGDRVMGGGWIGETYAVSATGA
ncbi:MAG: tRNA 2-thiouridine(34) synthase MnmA [Planctomycetales bacterium]|nr:tRNA 2-thiouridine(34) synthase MnmA [Planctomycetales bacterium]